MSVIRMFIWTCDACGIEAQKHDYGFPPGFRMVLVNAPNAAGAVVEHRCKNCPDALDRLSLEDAKNCDST